MFDVCGGLGFARDVVVIQLHVQDGCWPAKTSTKRLNADNDAAFDNGFMLTQTYTPQALAA